MSRADSAEARTPSRPGARSPKAASTSRRRRTIQLIIVFISCVLVVDSLVGEKGLLETMRARREDTELGSQIARLRAENAQLREQARRLREDPRAIEEVARRELGLMRPGELLFIIKDVPAAGK